MTSRRILIVEDEGIVALDLKSRLGLLGYEVAGTAADGERALQLAVQQRPDLVLMDIRLEGAIDGIQAAQAIRRQCRVPVVFLTAFSEDSTLERAKLAEPFGYVLKPFDERELKTTIEMALYKHQADEEIRRLSRLYATLSQVNQAIVRVSTRDELFREVCRVTVEYGEFRLAWVGWHDQASGRISPVASAGGPEDFVFQRQRDSRLEGDGSYFCGRAIRDQATAVVADLLADPTLGAWRPVLEQAGLRAAAAIPIRLRGDVCGLYVVYGDDPAVFRDREMQLLEEAASDLSFALDRLDSEEQRVRAEQALRDSENKFRSIFENMADASCLDEVVYENGLPVDYRVLDVNPAFERILGMPREGVLGRLASEVYGLVPFLETYARVAETGEPAAFEAWFEPAQKHLQITASCPARGRFSTVFSDVTARKQALDAVRQAQADLERAQAVAHVGSWTAEGPVSGTLKWSAETHRIFHLAPAAFDGRVETFLNLVHPQDRAQLLRAAEQAWRGEAPYSLEHRIVLADGSTRWVREQAEVQRDAGGCPLRMVGVVQDITDRKRTEQELRQNAARFRSLAELLQYHGAATQEFLDFALQQAITLTASRFGYIYLYHEDRKEFVLNTWSRDVMDECRVADPQTCYELDKTGIWGEAVRQRRPLLINDFQAANPLKKGYPEGHVPLHNYLTLPVISGQAIVAVVGVANKAGDYEPRDIEQLQLLMDAVWKVVEQRTAAEALRDSEEKYRELVENLNDVVFAADAEGRITYVSSLIQQVTGHAPGEVGGHRFREFIHAEDWGELERRLESTLRGEIAPIEFRYHAKDGQARWGCISSRPILQAGRVVGLRGIFSDITEKKTAAEENSRLAEQLRQAQKVEAIGRLAGGVAHDFNNMLGVILGYGELIRDELRPHDPLRDAAEQILAAGRRSADLTRQLLAFSRRQTLQPVVLDLNTVIRNMEPMLHRLIREDIQIELALAGDLSRVKADPGQVEQVLMNLTVNARDAMPHGGHVTIETANVELDDDYVRTHADVRPGKYVRLAVSDTGLGMDAQTAAHIFEPFFTTKDKGLGTGLGLSTVYGIVKQSEGHIWVYSEPGQGTTFKIYLPQTQAEVRSDSPRSLAPRQQSGNGQQILLVEDEDSLRNLIARALADLGYRVHNAANGGEALLLVEEKLLRPDLVITDVIMPNMSGSVLVERLKRSQPGLRVLYMSGYTENAIVHHGVLDKGIPFIQKPFNIRELAARAAEVLNAAPADAQAAIQVLLIDDDANFRELVRLACAKVHCRCTGVSTAAAALETLARQPVHVLLVDRNLPGTDERQVLAEIRAAGHTVPAMILTGDTYAANIEALRPLGVVGLLEKAADLRPLLAAIEDLARHRDRRS